MWEVDGKAPAVGTGALMLVVEDNPADVVLFQEAVEQTLPGAQVHVVPHGEEGLRFLRRQEPYDDAPRPDVVVLDLNLPVMSGREMLAEMMSEPALRGIPVAVLTTSSSERRVCDLCAAGQCLYFTKTDEFETLREIVRKIAAHARQRRSRDGDR